MIIMYIISLSLLFFISLFVNYKYFKLKSSIKEYNSIGTGRYGFYNYASGSYIAIVYVDEIDRYKDGYSKIKINHVEATGNWKSETIERVRNNFITLMLTNKIEWLESEDDIKKIRKEKLENLKKL